MGLKAYHQKRKFNVTPEPRGRQSRLKGDRFVIQKHAATRLHYDLRLELDGVMKSWAVTRGPSLVPGEKRLAVHVEDHPIEYNDFEGTIPQGEYGGGTVLIWDRGHWTPETDARKALAKGHLDFTLEGEKLHGRWHLVRLRGRPGEKRDNWLLIKAHDDWERGAKDADILEEQPDSVISGRSIDDIASGKGKARVWHSNRSVKDNVKPQASRSAHALGANGREPVRKAKAASAKASPESRRSAKGSAKKAKSAGGASLPEFVPPSLASLHSKAPDGAGWVHEIKFDGYRIQARLDHGGVKLLTRKGLDWHAKFPNITAAVAALPAETALLDGEIVVEDEHSVPSFSKLQAALKDGDTDSFRYYVFDLLHVDGRDLSSAPLLERKAELKRLIDAAESGDPIRYSEHFEADGSQLLAQACQMSLEGIVSKRADAPYRSGRNDDFVKVKCENAQEFVVGGFSPSTAMPRAIGALVVGVYDKGRLIYTGRVGTGYTQAVARDLWKRLEPLTRSRPPFDEIPAAEARRRDVVWVEPRTVIETHFRGWTADRLLRQAAFKGVRDDKPAGEVGRELPAESISERAMAKAASKNSRADTVPAKRAQSKPSATRSPVAKPSVLKRSAAAEAAPAGAVRITHPERVYWADVGVTKQDLVAFYRSVWDVMAPQVAGRPLSLLRCPEGVAGECFFQKHASAGLAEDRLRTVIDSKRRQIIAVDDIEGLVSLVQAGVLEVHVRGSRIESLDRCDRIVFDLDPGEGVGWPDIVKAARDVRERLAAIDLECFVKLTGGKGLHVVVPIAGTDWEITKTFVQAFAMAMAADEPDRYVAKMTKAIRGGRVFVDYLRNSLEQTAVAAYSTRARAGAPVSVPVTWDELARVKAANQYTVLNLGKRLGSLKRDPWADIGKVKQRLPDLRKLRQRK